MVRLFLTGVSAAVAGLTLSMTVDVGVASADPDLGPVINTTCNYSQVVSALNAQNPAAAAGLSASPTTGPGFASSLNQTQDRR
jgi:hypothetical protein